MKTATLVAYWLLVIGVMTGHISGMYGFVFVCKPLLMMMLAFYVFWSLYKFWLDEESMIAFALLGAWVGDVSLMIADANIAPIWKERAFMIGLAGFFAMQTCYINAFHKTGDRTKVLLTQRYKFLLLPFAAFAISMFFVLRSGGKMEGWIINSAVFVYAWSLTLMVLTVLNRFGRVSNLSFGLTMAGGVMFMASDLLIGLNKFVLPIPYADIFIMGLYMPAQFLIIEGFVRQGKIANAVP
jgi:uncharacterized membrane protein YhhN